MKKKSYITGGGIDPYVKKKKTHLPTNKQEEGCLLFVILGCLLLFGCSYLRLL